MKHAKGFCVLRLSALPKQNAMRSVWYWKKSQSNGNAQWEEVVEYLMLSRWNVCDVISYISFPRSHMAPNFPLLKIGWKQQIVKFCHFFWVRSTCIDFVDFLRKMQHSSKKECVFEGTPEFIRGVLCELYYFKANIKSQLYN